MEKVQKPASVAKKELTDTIVSAINGSGLPAFIISPILRDTLTQLQDLETKQYEAEKKEYEKNLRKAEEAERKKQEEEVRVIKALEDREEAMANALVKED